MQFILTIWLWVKTLVPWDALGTLKSPGFMDAYSPRKIW